TASRGHRIGRRSGRELHKTDHPRVPFTSRLRPALPKDVLSPFLVLACDGTYLKPKGTITEAPSASSGEEFPWVLSTFSSFDRSRPFRVAACARRSGST